MTAAIIVQQQQPPEHVRAAFGLRGANPVAIDDDPQGAWRVGDVVLTPVTDLARAAWSAKIRETLTAYDVQIAHPVRSSDGRYVVSGWRADAFLAGRPEPRHDEVIATAVRLHAATSELARPRFLYQQPTGKFDEVDVFVAADRAAWEPTPLRGARGAILARSADGGRGSHELLRQLATLRRPVRAQPQLVHGDLYGTVLFNGTAAPAITDITPYWRPASWAAGVAAVDALAWGGADDGILERWSDLDEWPQMLLRAVMFRLAVHALHPRSTSEALPGLARVASLVRLML